MIALFLLAATAATAAPTFHIEGLRNNRGTIEICLTRNPGHFPKCDGDPGAISKKVSAASPDVTFEGLPPGDYAACVFHDENNDRKLNTVLGIPREGFGFSRNPKIRFGPPKFSDAVISIAAGTSRKVVRITYLL